MKKNNFYMVCAPGFEKKTGYYFRCIRDIDVMQSIECNFLGFMHLNSLKNIIASCIKLLRDNESIFIFENISTCILTIPFIFIRKANFRRFILIYHGSLEDLNAFRFYKIKRFLYKSLEKYVIHKSINVLCVSKVMMESFQNEYQQFKSNFYLSPNTPSTEFITAIEKLKFKDKKNIRSELNLPEDKVIICYSGNTQAWQKINVLIELINSANENYYFIILTNDINYFTLNIKSTAIDKVLLKTVDNLSVPKYLMASDFLYLLREINETNSHSCPTKAVEYLYTGLPMIISQKLGDITDITRRNLNGIIVNDINDINFKILNKEILDYKKVNSIVLPEEFKFDYAACLFKKLVENV